MKKTTQVPIADQEQIDKWKQQHGEGNVHGVAVPHTNVDAAVKLKAYFKKPSFATMAKISRYGEAHAEKALEVFFEECYLGGDKEIQQYDEYRLSVFQKAVPMFQVPEAELLKL